MTPVRGIPSSLTCTTSIINFQATRLPPQVKIAAVEQSFGQQIASPHFLPFIQLQEFEGLLSLNNALVTIYQRYYGQPELINDSQHTASSKRIL
jgi:hypothetical protein